MLMVVKKELKVMLLSIKYNIMKEMVNPLSFILKVLFMMLNNSTFIIEWIILFTFKDSFGEYGFKEIMLFWGIASGTFGFSRLFFGGAYKIPEYVEEGKLDSYLVQPTNTLNGVITSFTSISALGDLLYGLIIAFIFFHSLTDILLIILYIVTGGIIYTAYTVIVSCLAFKYTKVEDLAKSIIELMLSFSIYPDSIYGEFLKIFFYTVLPVGFMVFLPIKSILDVNIIYIAIVIIFTLFITLLSYIIFNKGLKSYSSTNLMTGR